MFTLIFDTETTGLPKNWSSPISDSNNWPRLVQLSYIIDEDGKQEEFDCIIRPDGFIIPADVAAIHGISHERALAEGIELKDAIVPFMTAMKKADKVVAHNISFDRAIIGAECYRLGAGKRFEEIESQKELFCTMRKASDILRAKNNPMSITKWPKLIDLYEHLFHERFDGAHNSLMDTRACARVYFELIK